MMNQWVEYNENDPRYYTSKIKKQLSDMVSHLREDERKVDDPKARALFEVTAEVLTGLRKAFDDYEDHAPAWR